MDDEVPRYSVNIIIFSKTRLIIQDKNINATDSIKVQVRSCDFYAPNWGMINDCLQRLHWPPWPSMIMSPPLVSLTASPVAFLDGSPCSSHRGLLLILKHGLTSVLLHYLFLLSERLFSQRTTPPSRLRSNVSFLIQSTQTTLFKFTNCASCPFPQSHLPSSNITLFSCMFSWRSICKEECAIFSNPECHF